MCVALYTLPTMYVELHLWAGHLLPIIHWREVGLSEAQGTSKGINTQQGH